MSFGGQQTKPFLDPLEGKTTAFVVCDRISNLRFAEAILPLIAGDERGCDLLDLDAFYSSSLDSIASRVSTGGMKNLEITIPEPGSDIESTLANLFQGRRGRSLMIDSVNSLYQLLSSPNPKSSGRKFAFLISALSAWARDNRKSIFASIYERRAVPRSKMSRSLADAFDYSVSVSTEPRGVTFSCERGGPWRNGSFFLPLQVREEYAHEHRDGDQKKSDTQV